MPGRLELRNLQQSRGALADSPILFSNLNCIWDSPSLHVIVGPSGSGKSTFLKTLAGFLPAKGGQIQWKGAPIRPGLTRELGFTFQKNALFASRTVLENLTIVPGAEMSSILELLDRVGLASSLQKFPHELSGGMQKRLALVRALVLKPEILLLDDPIAGLDPITGQEILELLFEIQRNQNTLIVMVMSDVLPLHSLKQDYVLHRLAGGEMQ